MNNTHSTSDHVEIRFDFAGGRETPVQEILRFSRLGWHVKVSSLICSTYSVSFAMANSVAQVLIGKQRPCCLTYAEKKVLCAFLSKEELAVGVVDACMDDTLSVIDLRLVAEEIFYNDPETALFCLQQTISIDRAPHIKFCRGEDVFDIFQVSWLLLGQRRLREFLIYVRNFRSDLYAQAINNVYAVREDYLSSQRA